MSYSVIDEIVGSVIENSVTASIWDYDDDTSRAYREGAAMMAEFFKMNPTLITNIGNDHVEILFPSRINNL